MTSGFRSRLQFVQGIALRQFVDDVVAIKLFSGERDEILDLLVSLIVDKLQNFRRGVLQGLESFDLIQNRLEEVSFCQLPGDVEKHRLTGALQRSQRRKS